MFEYVPAPAPVDAPLVLALHACSQTASDYQNAGWNTLADELGFYVVYPEQQTANNPIRCFNWAGEYGDPTNLMRGQGENESIRQMVEKALADHSIDPSRVYLSGFSGGGAQVALMMATWPELFAGGAILAGIPYNCTTTFTEVSTCLSPGIDRTPAQWGDRARAGSPSHAGPYPKVSLWQGTADTTVRPLNQTELLEQWTNVHGIDMTPDAMSMIDGHAHEEYRDGSGNTLVEVYRVNGMGHGTPVLPAEMCGAAGAFFLDAGTCSARRIAEFFDLDTAVMPGDRTPPAVSIQSPAEGASVMGTVSIRATATDDVGVTEVRIALNGTVKATRTSAPFGFDWDTGLEANGSYRIDVTAFDAAGNSTSASVTVTVAGGIDDTTPPMVAITSPVEGTPLTGVVEVAIDATDDFGVANVTLSVDGVERGSTSMPPYRIALDTATLSPGPHSLGAAAWDAAGNAASSAAVGVTVEAGDTTAPIVRIDAPLPGAAVGGIAEVHVSATDATGIHSVLLFLDGELIGSDYRGPAYAFLWDTAASPEGAHTLTARAFDPAGNVGVAEIGIDVVRTTVEEETEKERVLAGKRYWGCEAAPGELALLWVLLGVPFLVRRRAAALLALLAACGGEPIYVEVEAGGDGLTTPSRVMAFLDGRSLVMEGDRIPTHPNGFDQNRDFGAATQCYMRVTMAPLGGRFSVKSELGTLANDACDRTRLSGEASFVSTAVLVEKVEGDAECFDFTITYAGFGQEGRGRILPDRSALELELFFKDHAIGHRCADGAVGSRTVTLNQAPFDGDATQVYAIGG